MKPYYSNELTTIYNGDCLEVMDKINDKFNLVLTSPPYNIIRPNCSDRGYDKFQDSLLSNDEYALWIVNIFKKYDELLNKNGVVLLNMSYGAENTEVMNITIAEVLKSTNFSIADILIWKKKSATPNNVSKNRLTRIVEFVYVFVRKNEIMTFKTNKKVIGVRKDTNQDIYENLFNFFTTKNNDSSTEINKATFSSDFVHHLLSIYYVNGNVLDNFGGTGTTSYACSQLGIKNTMIELSEEQCKYSTKRLNSLQIKFDI